MLLPLVQLAPDAHPDIQAACQRIAPDSVLVLILRTDRTPVLYYEGGAYERPATRQPSRVERVNYAVRAAGRATAHDPTVARLVLPEAKPADFLQEGWIDTSTWLVTCLSHPQPIKVFSTNRSVSSGRAKKLGGGSGITARESRLRLSCASMSTRKPAKEPLN
jgi:hypothetical protein